LRKHEIKGKTISPKHGFGISSGSMAAAIRTRRGIMNRRDAGRGIQRDMQPIPAPLYLRGTCALWRDAWETEGRAAGEPPLAPTGNLRRLWFNAERRKRPGKFPHPLSKTAFDSPKGGRPALPFWNVA
jgi:hypothetical protein